MIISHLDESLLDTTRGARGGKQARKQQDPSGLLHKQENLTGLLFVQSIFQSTIHKIRFQLFSFGTD